MTSSQERVPNERLQRARSLKGWSQADLAEQVGTSFEIVSRWERGMTVPSPYYRERLCVALGQSAEELGLLGNRLDALTSPPSPFVLLASSHVDAEKPIVSHLKTVLQEQGSTLWSSRQISRQGKGHLGSSLHEFVQAAQVILVIISPAAGSSRHVREALELAGRYQRPVCGVWIEGEHLQECLPKGSGEVVALIDARTSDGPILIEELRTSLERVEWKAPVNGRLLAPPFSGAEEIQPTNQPIMARELFTSSASTVPSRNASPGTTRSSQNRQRFLAKVRAFWISDVLEKSLQGAALIPLGLQEEADALANPWASVFRPPEQTAQSFPGGTRITQVYDNAGGELLILGEPGSGKTTLLLELARDLLQCAEQDSAHPMPVILNLSSWAVKRQPLADWLVEELNSKYQVPRRIGQTWMSTDQLFPLLDGLDEVDPTYQAACIEALNTYRREHGLVPMVVCSRRTEYLEQPTRLLLRSAVVVQPLTAEQIDDYLASGGEKLAAIGVALCDDPVLQELTTTPLMLSILAVTYAGKPVEGLSVSGLLEERRQDLLATYTQRMLQRRGRHKRYSPQQTSHWLHWLARQLVGHRQTVFYLEQMQLDWLPTQRWQGFLLCSGLGVIIGLLCFLGFEFALLELPTLQWLMVGLLLGALNALLYILFNGLIFGFESKQDMARKATRAAWWGSLRRRLSSLLANRVLYGFIYMVPNLLFLLMFLHVSRNLPGFFLDGIAIWLAYAVLGKFEAEIRPVEVISWSWSRVRKHLPQMVIVGLLGGVISGTLFKIFPFFDRRAQSGPVPFSLTILVLALGIGLSVALLLGLTHEVLDTHKRIVPNQGIRNSLRNGVVLGLVYGVIVGTLFSVISGSALVLGRAVAFPFTSPGEAKFLLVASLGDGVALGLLTAMVVFLRSGGIASLQHLFLRLLLWRAGCIPWQYPRFLDYASECILLRKTGGGYLFMHGLLLDYFASQGKAASAHHGS